MQVLRGEYVAARCPRAKLVAHTPHLQHSTARHSTARHSTAARHACVTSNFM
jgi:hypothetical protein